MIQREKYPRTHKLLHSPCPCSEVASSLHILQFVETSRRIPGKESQCFWAWKSIHKARPCRWAGWRRGRGGGVMNHMIAARLARAHWFSCVLDDDVDVSSDRPGHVMTSIRRHPTSHSKLAAPLTLQIQTAAQETEHCTHRTLTIGPSQANMLDTLALRQAQTYRISKWSLPFN